MNKIIFPKEYTAPFHWHLFLKFLEGRHRYFAPKPVLPLMIFIAMFSVLAGVFLYFFAMAAKEGQGNKTKYKDSRLKVNRQTAVNFKLQLFTFEIRIG